MEFQQAEWLGAWENFENYMDSPELLLVEAWERAENAARQSPALQRMFAGGVQAFWRMACSTCNAENDIPVSGWRVEAAEDGLLLDWLDEAGGSLGKAVYRPAEIVEKALEGKPNYLFRAADAPAGWKFTWLMAMAPLPPRTARDSGGLISHIHYQFASEKEKLVRDTGLVNPRWYATMCLADASPAEKRQIVLALHQLPLD